MISLENIDWCISIGLVPSILLGAILPSYCQEMNGIKFHYTTDKVSGRGLALIELLRKDVPITRFEDCGCSFGFFYFRLSSQNRIDSVYYESTLNKEQENKIVENIKKTEGSWQFPKEKDSSKKYWFVYPFFDLGERHKRGKNCTEAEQKAWDNLFMISNNINKMTSFNRRFGAILVPAEQTSLPKF